MAEIKRYHPWWFGEEMEEDPQGGWMLWEDHERAMSELRDFLLGQQGELADMYTRLLRSHGDMIYELSNRTNPEEGA